MNWGNLIAGGAITGMLFGVITACWTRVKGFFWRLFAFVIQHVDIRDDHSSQAVLTYLLRDYKRSRFYDKTYGGAYEFTREGKYGIVAFEFFGGKALLFWKGWLPIAYGLAQTTTGTANFSGGNGKGTLTFIRGTFNAEDIIAKACTERNEMLWSMGKDDKVRRFFIKTIPDAQDKSGTNRYAVGTSVAWYQEGIYRLLCHEPSQLGKCQPGKIKALDLLIFPDRIKNLIREIQIWRRNRQWYIDRGIPWKRGWVLHGVPGTGKTALVRAFAEDLDMPLFVFSLGEITNTELQRAWDDMQAHVPCIALFEDIDNVFHGRNNIAGSNLGIGQILMNQLEKPAPAPAPAAGPSPDGTKTEAAKESSVPKMGYLSFDCLLNCIDGVKKSDGIFTVITTNHIEHIDAALGQPRKMPDGTLEFISTRPGRIDKAIELTVMDAKDKLVMANRILGDYPEAIEEMRDWLKKYEDLPETPAQFQERCAQLALSFFWMEQNKSEGLTGSDGFKSARQKALYVSTEVA